MIEEYLSGVTLIKNKNTGETGRVASVNGNSVCWLKDNGMIVKDNYSNLKIIRKFKDVNNIFN